MFFTLLVCHFYYIYSPDNIKIEYISLLRVFCIYNNITSWLKKQKWFHSPNISFINKKVIISSCKRKNHIQNPALGFFESIGTNKMGALLPSTFKTADIGDFPTAPTVKSQGVYRNYKHQDRECGSRVSLIDSAHLILYFYNCLYYR